MDMMSSSAETDKRRSSALEILDRCKAEPEDVIAKVQRLEKEIGELRGSKRVSKACWRKSGAL